MIARFVLLVALLSLTVSCLVSAREISGEVFIRTNDGETLVGSAVDVQAFAYSDFNEWADKFLLALYASAVQFEQAKGIYEKATEIHEVASRAHTEAVSPGSNAPAEKIAGLEKVSREALSNMASSVAVLTSARAIYSEVENGALKGAPKPVASTVTNSRGEYRFDVPNDATILAVRYERQVSSEPEVTFWFVKLESGSEPVSLSFTHRNSIKFLDFIEGERKRSP